MVHHTPQIARDLVECEGRLSEEFHEVRCEECLGCGTECKVLRPELERFVVDVLRACRLPERDAAITARVLVAADMRGIASHGVARLGRYVKGIKEGYIVPGVEFDIREPAPTIAVIDARNGVGQVVADLAMDMAIERAASHGVGVVTVSNSNHYGIAGYYVQKAVDAGMIGMSMTNAAPLVVPTNGADAVLGTNPISLGAPGRDGFDFMLDMATSVVPRGKLEVYDRNRRQMPVGWAVDEKGYDSKNAGHVLANLLSRAGGGILPLGGRGEEFGGHKGYGLALMVDVLCGVLSGAAFATDVDNVRGPSVPGQVRAPRVGHFFLALDVKRFMPLEEFRDRLASLFAMLKASRKALDKSEIYIHGEKEQVRARLHERAGVPLSENVLDALRKIAAEFQVPPPATVAERLKRLAKEAE